MKLLEHGDFFFGRLLVISSVSLIVMGYLIDLFEIGCNVIVSIF